MNLIIFGGFFGSGKTTLILSLAQYLVAKEGATEKPELVIIENEVGEVGIDNKVLETGGFTVKELFSGCVCCQLSTSLTLTLNDIGAKIDPKWVIIEATGLAYPGNVLSTLMRNGKGIESARVVTVVDAERWEEFYQATPMLVKSQVEDGNIILVNKVDVVSGEQQESVENTVAQLNPEAEVCPISANQGIEPTIWNKVVEVNA